MWILLWLVKLPFSLQVFALAISPVSSYLATQQFPNDVPSASLPFPTKPETGFQKVLKLGFSDTEVVLLSGCAGEGTVGGGAVGGVAPSQILLLLCLLLGDTERQRPLVCFALGRSGGGVDNGHVSDSGLCKRPTWGSSFSILKMHVLNSLCPLESPAETARVQAWLS